MKGEKQERGKRLALSSVTSLVSQAVTVVCGFVMTRLILTAFGSEINGLTGSITQFLGFIAFLEMGIGAVVKSALYQPLAEGDQAQISRIMKSCRQFYRKIGLILVAYTAVLMVLFPLLTAEFDFFYTASLVLIISISLFAQYFFGMPYQLLLNADQRAYVPTLITFGTLVANTLAAYIAIHLGATIHVVRLLTAAIYVMRPVMMALYVRRHYSLDDDITLTEEPLKQKWNGLAQHIAYVVVNYTDIAVLTLFSTFASVSVYSVYHNVTIGVQQIISSLSVGVSSMIGNVLYSEKIDETRKTFALTEWAFHTVTVLLFTMTGLLIVPFVRIYTAGVTDAEYILPAFAVLITLAQAAYSIRIPYETMVLSANHFKQTQKSAVIEVIINITLSVVLVKFLGLVGVAIGTLAAMAYRTVYFVVYLSKNILQYRISSFFRSLALDGLQVVCCVLLCRLVTAHLQADSWVGWILLAAFTGVICLAVCALVNVLFNRRHVIDILSRVRALTARSLARGDDSGYNAADTHSSGKGSAGMKSGNRIEMIFEYMILCLMFLAGLNLFDRYHIVVFGLFAVCVIKYRGIALNKPMIFYALTALAAAAAYLNWGIKLGLALMMYMVGYMMCLSKGRAGVSEQETWISRSLTALCAGLFVHMALNMLMSVRGGFTRNVPDVWTGAVMSAAGHSALAAFPVALSCAWLFFPQHRWQRLAGLAVIATGLAFTLILGARTIPVFCAVNILMWTVYRIAHEPDRVRRQKIIVRIVFSLIAFALAIAIDLFGIRSIFETTRFYIRFKRLKTFSNMMSDGGRLTNKINYLTNLHLYPFGGENMRARWGYAHDLILDCYDEGGILEIVPLIGLLVSAVMESVRFIRKSAVDFKVKAVIAGILVTCAVEFFVEPVIEGVPFVFICFAYVQGMLHAINGPDRRITLEGIIRRLKGEDKNTAGVS